MARQPAHPDGRHVRERTHRHRRDRRADVHESRAHRPQAWEQIQKYSNDGGAPGPDSDYGKGIVNLGWALNATTPSRVDTAISSHYYDPATGTMSFVVQNRGGTMASGLQLVVENGGPTSSTILVPFLQPGASYVAKTTIDQATLIKNGGMASGLAGGMGKLATVGLAAAVFGAWMNISGSILANYWKRRPVDPVQKSPSP